jgi:hypothetical protein
MSRTGTKQIRMIWSHGVWSDYKLKRKVGKKERKRKEIGRKGKKRRKGARTPVPRK